MTPALSGPAAQGPEMCARAAPDFVGRERELATMVQALRHPPALVLVEGEAGIGKSRLVREALTTLAPPDGMVLEIVCPPVRDPFPLGALVDALHRLGLRDLELSPLAGALRPLFPEWAARLPPSLEPLDDPRATRHRLFRAFAELIERQGVHVVVVEDAHWADPATLEFLLTRSSALDESCLLATYRATDIPEGSPLLRLTSRSSTQPRPIRLAPEPLTPAETRALISSLFASAQVSTDFVAFLHRHTGGLPLALEESLWLLQDRGEIVRRGGEWTRRHAADILQVPPTVRDSVLERVERLSREARRVLEAAAVLAEPAREPLLARVSALGEHRTRRGLAAALRSGLLQEADPGRFVLRHVLASRAVEETIPASELRRLHRRAGQVLREQDLNASPARLSRHFQQAGDVVEWSSYAEAAADLALKSGDDRAAVVSLHQLLTTADLPPSRRTRVARKLAEAAAGGVASLGELGGQLIRVLRDVLARQDGPAEERGRIRLLLGRLLLQLGEFDEACQQNEAAVAELRHDPALAARAMMALALPRGNQWPASTHREWLARATRLMPRVPPGAERLSLIADQVSVQLFLGDQEGWRIEAGTADDAPTISECRQIARMRLNAGHIAIAWGYDELARRRLQQAAGLMRSTGYQRLVNSVGLTMAYLDWQAGAWDGLADRVMEVAAADDTLPEAHLEARLVLAMLNLVAGHRNAAYQELEEVRSEAERRGVVDAQMAPAAALGRIHLAEGAAGEAARVTQSGIDLIILKGAWVWAVEITPVRVEALVRSGRLGAAEELAEAFAAALAGRDAPAPAAALETCRGHVALARGDLRDAADRFARAARAWSTLPRPYAQLLAAERQGRALLAAGEQEQAVAVLTAAQQRLRGLNAYWDAERVARLLREHGVEVARIWRGGRRGYGDQLSPRELEVSRLVARGLTNRQVADELFLSPRTIDRHLSAAMRKLGETSRTGLAVAVAAAGLLSDGDGRS